MLITMANNQTIAAGASATFTYSPHSVQRVMINAEDADWEDAKVTIQIGSLTICNGATMYGLLGLSQLQCGVNVDVTNPNGFITLDLGSHQCTQNANLYVTIQAVAEVVAVDVSAIVDEPTGGQVPLRITEYSDQTFTSNHNVLGVSFDAAEADIDEDAYNCEIKTSLYSSSPSFISASSYYKAVAVSGNNPRKFGLLNKHSKPLKTTYNYSSSAVTDRIITVEFCGSTPLQVVQAKRQYNKLKGAS